MLDAQMKECMADPPFLYKDGDRVIAPARKLDPAKTRAQLETIEMGLSWGILSSVLRSKRVDFVLREVFVPTQTNEYRYCLAPASNYKSRYNASVQYPSEHERWAGCGPADVFFMVSEDVRKAFWTVRMSNRWRRYARMRDSKGGYVQAERMMFRFDFAPHVYDEYMRGIFETQPFEPRMERMVDNLMLLGRQDELRAFLLDLLAFYALCDRHNIPLKAERQFLHAWTNTLGRVLSYHGTLEASEISIKRLLDVDAKFEGAVLSASPCGWSRSVLASKMR
jgi:hypothetical protein